MKIDIQHRPSYALGIVDLDGGEALAAETGAMVSMSGTIQIETQAKGGVLGGVKRMLGGESFFINTYRAEEGPGQVTVAPSLPGDIVHRTMSGETLMVQSTSYIASSPEVTVDSKWGGAKTFFSGEGFILLKVSGTGELLMSSFGAIHELELAAGETYVVDTGHMVAFEEGVGYEVKKVGGWKSTILSGEGLVVRLTGPGKVYIQTRSPDSFLSWLVPLLPKDSGR